MRVSDVEESCGILLNQESRAGREKEVTSEVKRSRKGSGRTEKDKAYEDVLVEADGYITKGSTCPVSSVPPCVP
ncbi:hypothetical protein E2C01_092493 [Portunus trituberculatus]|uniref:Uncharacterized protein n=1 Tax=Portunus trituberculatus TaxID=210409 RepID=A0A5B7JM36_PORTR|nr:hypothetical protein [Portunus trituberculatus]